MKTKQLFTAMAIMMAMGTGTMMASAKASDDQAQRGARAQRQEMVISSDQMTLRAARVADSPAQVQGGRIQQTIMQAPQRTTGGHHHGESYQGSAQYGSQASGQYSYTSHQGGSQYDAHQYYEPQRTGGHHDGYQQSGHHDGYQYDGHHDSYHHDGNHHADHYDYDIHGYEDRVRHMDDGRWSYYRDGQWHCYDQYIAPAEYYSQPMSRWGKGVIITATVIAALLAVLLD